MFIMRDLSPSAEGTVMMNKKKQILSLPMTELPLVADVEGKDVVAENAS